MHLSTFLAASFVTAALTAAIAQPIVVTPAPPDSTPVIRHVSYADLNLALDAGVQTLQHRVDGAVVAVCSNAGPTDVQPCQSGARASAQRQMDDAVAVARHALVAARH
jgi:UrcA family protein